MKTISKLAALGVLTLGFSFGVLGCGEDNNKSVMLNPDGSKSAPGHTAEGTPRTSEEFQKRAQQNSPTSTDEYKKAMQSK